MYQEGIWDEEGSIALAMLPARAKDRW